MAMRTVPVAPYSSASFIISSISINNRDYRFGYFSIVVPLFFLEFVFLDMLLFPEGCFSFSGCTEKTILYFLIIEERMDFIGGKLPIFDKQFVIVVMSAFVIIMLPSYRTAGVN
jgi:hypothetical protein